MYLGERVAVLSARPGRLKEIVDINIPDRDGDEDIRSNQAFVEHRHQVWTLLHDEVRRAQDAGHRKILPDGSAPDEPATITERSAA